LPAILKEMLQGQDALHQLEAIKVFVKRIVEMQTLLGVPKDRCFSLYKIACFVADGASVNNALLEELNKARRLEFDSQPEPDLYRGCEFFKAE
jgi:hypothetical protein